MTGALRHVWRTFVHKARVFAAAVLHDLSKLGPAELRGHADDVAGQKTLRVLMARLIHRHRNRHHWQWWVYIRDDGTFESLEMPRAVVVEMIADWRAAAAKYGSSAEAFWRTHGDDLILHPATRRCVEAALGERGGS